MGEGALAGYQVGRSEQGRGGLTLHVITVEQINLSESSTSTSNVAEGPDTYSVQPPYLPPTSRTIDSTADTFRAFVHPANNSVYNTHVAAHASVSYGSVQHTPAFQVSLVMQSFRLCPHSWSHQKVRVDEDVKSEGGHG